MTVVAARRYRDGKLVDPALPPDCAPPAKSEFDWVGLVEPSPEEMAQVQANYALHPLAVEDALTQRHAPKAAKATRSKTPTIRRRNESLRTLCMEPSSTRIAAGG